MTAMVALDRSIKSEEGKSRLPINHILLIPLSHPFHQISSLSFYLRITSRTVQAPRLHTRLTSAQRALGRLSTLSPRSIQQDTEGTSMTCLLWIIREREGRGTFDVHQSPASLTSPFLPIAISCISSRQPNELAKVSLMADLHRCRLLVRSLHLYLLHELCYPTC
jgi:hypothetical protein